MTDPTEAEIRQHLEALLASDCLSKSVTSQRLLTYLVQRSLGGPDGPKETEIALDVFGRDASFNGGDDSVVRVAMRGLRQKLIEYYAGAGRNDPLAFDIPKGSYRLAVLRRTAPEAKPQALAIPDAVAVDVPPARRWGKGASAVAALLAVSLLVNLHLWRERAADQRSTPSQLRGSEFWRDIAASRRPVMFVLGDLFMYTQADPVTGRTQTVRDPQINSSEDLRSFLASNPQLASERGLRYASYVQKSTAAGMAAIIPIIDAQRSIEVRLRDELRAEDLRRYDIVYVGPLSRIGPLDGSFHGNSRYRFDARTAVLTDIQSGQKYEPEGDLGGHHKDYALVSRFEGPVGNTILIITAGGRNAGLQQVIRAITTPSELAQFEARLRDSGAGQSHAFEALIEVTGYKQTDLSAAVLDLHTIPVAPFVPATVAN